MAIYKKEILFVPEEKGVRKYYILCRLIDHAYHVFKSDMLYFDDEFVPNDEDDAYYRDYMSEIIEMKFYNDIEAAINNFNNEF